VTAVRVATPHGALACRRPAARGGWRAHARGARCYHLAQLLRLLDAAQCWKCAAWRGTQRHMAWRGTPQPPASLAAIHGSGAAWQQKQLYAAHWMRAPPSPALHICRLVKVNPRAGRRCLGRSALCTEMEARHPSPLHAASTPPHPAAPSRTTSTRLSRVRGRTLARTITCLLPTPTSSYGLAAAHQGHPAREVGMQEALQQGCRPHRPEYLHKAISPPSSAAVWCCCSSSRRTAVRAQALFGFGG
jgi:hypothetical protein